MPFETTTLPYDKTAPPLPSFATTPTTVNTLSTSSANPLTTPTGGTTTPTTKYLPPLTTFTQETSTPSTKYLPPLTASTEGSSTTSTKYKPPLTTSIEGSSTPSTQYLPPPTTPKSVTPSQKPPMTPKYVPPSFLTTPVPHACSSNDNCTSSSFCINGRCEDPCLLFNVLCPPLYVCRVENHMIKCLCPFYSFTSENVTSCYTVPDFFGELYEL
ncbi:integumentary mucin C.1-like [Diaphorina citri]|uniref:Integumentary mucin C.1-like n=1 Tax=Diaphorina citri TaxID=121845 RepID=A0A3Q0IV61_DIACI|nr:integumentary mucin C.1-like [Diaphorina citri]